MHCHEENSKILNKWNVSLRETWLNYSKRFVLNDIEKLRALIIHN